MATGGATPLVLYRDCRRVIKFPAVFLTTNEFWFDKCARCGEMLRRAFLEILNT